MSVFIQGKEDMNSTEFEKLPHQFPIVAKQIFSIFPITLLGDIGTTTAFLIEISSLFFSLDGKLCMGKL
jgi:hypothetical protein